MVDGLLALADISKGYCKGGKSSIRFVLRDEAGDVRFALGREIQEVTNNEAEAITILEALRYCVQHRYTHILLQTDSMLMKNVIDGTWIAPWAVITYVEEIKDIMEENNFRISHIMREGNKLADYLANYAIDV
ncbi:uncharacterized protein [Nicotiana tomentosiformis]|uniref:uncharacterized protein n=1 Tax=Nicotiana tomentosiformis TaxID=4098 RepID=UPI00388C4BD8